MTTRLDLATDSRNAFEEGRVLRWGGIAGMLGGALMLTSLIVVGALGLPDTSDMASLLTFPDISTGRIVENTLYLAALTLWAFHLLALYWALRNTSLALALYGSALGIFGVVVLAAGALPHIATAVLSDLYHSPLASAADQTTLVFVWRGSQSVFDALLTTGALLAPLGLVTLGAAMRHSPAYGSRFGWFSIALGVVGFAGAAVSVVDAASLAIAASILGLMAFHLVVGWKTYRASKAS